MKPIVGLPILFHAAIFVSAFLLFQIQPLISKVILPWFGGTPNVWTTCILFFQGVLFFGYLYAHLLSSYFSARSQAAIHVCLLLATLSLLQIIPGAELRPREGDYPAVTILLILASTVGAPYFLLSTQGPLLQAWFSKSFPTRSPYRLYALSNAGSLLALISYPFVIEPMTGLGQQAELWSMAYLLMAGMIILLALSIWRSGATSRGPEIATEASTGHAPSPPVLSPGEPWIKWFGLSMLASTALLSTTNQVCQDVAAVPFLWVIPLSLYLVTFILCFESERWYCRKAYSLGGLVLFSLVVLVFLLPEEFSIQLQVSVYFAGLFVGCMLCHGELARLKPAPAKLTAFYLTLAAGGVCGGIFVSLIAPTVFPFFFEFDISLLACVLLALLIYFQEARRKASSAHLPFRSKFAVLALILPLLPLYLHTQRMLDENLSIYRNFYGVLQIEESVREADGQRIRSMVHGRVNHGAQFQSDNLLSIPTTYYGLQSAIGQMMQLLQANRQAIKVGVVGLGVGTLASYGRSSDLFRFYEINTQVVKLANTHFSYLNNTPSRTEIILGDARLSLEQEPRQHYDLLAIDAFSGDAIPTHLLSREVMDTYLAHIKDTGVLAIHISNKYLDLDPVVSALAEEAGLIFRILRSKGNADTAEQESWWLLASFLNAPIESTTNFDMTAVATDRRVYWSDNYSNLFTILK